MRWWKVSSVLTLAMVLGALGCSSNNPSSGVALSITPTTASVITNTTQQFTGAVRGATDTTITWTLTCATDVAANTCGSIDSNGLYSAPATLPTVTTNGTTTIAPTATITATANADTTKTQTATLTIITGIRISMTPLSATVGTGEHFTFSASVSNPGCNITSTPNCLDVTWSVSSTATGVGTIDPNTGVYTAPATAPSPSLVTIRATSVADTSVVATATASVVTATPPTVTSVSPNTTARGGLFQDIYITGTNFISTNNVYINGVQLSSSNVAKISNSVIRARIPDFLLAAPPLSGIFQLGVAQQTGTPVTCTDASQCQITVKAVRPGLTGPSPDSIPQGGPQGGGALSFNVNGGFFGTATNPAVSATYAGQLRALQLPSSGTTSSTRQLSVTIGGSANSNDFSTPGLFPVAVRSASDDTKVAVANLAVRPNYTTPTATQVPVGAAPSDVAVNPATGLAVVANRDSNDISLIDLTAPSPAVVATICTAAVGAVAPCPSSGPTSVSVDYVRNLALVVNTAAKTIAVVDLNTKLVTYVTPALQDSPGAVGVNPVTGRALVAMQSRNYGVLMDLTQTPPAFVGTVSISTGPNTRVAVEPHLNWAIATPGGAGSLGIVDLNRQTVNHITTLTRTNNVVMVTVQASTPSVPQSPLGVKVNDAVQIQGVSDPTFNGIYTVTAVGPGSAQFSYTQTGATQPDVGSLTSSGTVNYSNPVATVALTTAVQGIGVNPETQQAVLVDPTITGAVTFFNLIDQTTSQLYLKTNSSIEVGTTAAAYNPLTDTVVAVNSYTNTLSVIDPSGPARLNDGNLFSTGLSSPVAIAIDPGTNVAVVANQTGNTVSVLQLGAIQPFSITETSPKTFVTTSTLTQSPNPAPQQLTILGKGLTCVNSTTNLTVRLDAIPLQTFCTGNGDRALTAIVPPSLLTTARRYALDVADAGGNTTNAEQFTVEQSVDVTGCSATPYPASVAIDAQQNIAAVSLFGCNSLALINLETGTGQSVNVGANPMGVAVIPRLHLAVVANNGSGNASVVDELGGSVQSTITTGSGSVGAAADQDTGEVAITNSVSNTVTVLNPVTGQSHSISTGQRPIAVAFNYVNHELGVAASASNALSIAEAAATSPLATYNVTVPTSVVYDPAPEDCGPNNTDGCFIVNSSTNNSAQIIDPTTGNQFSFRIGINPTAIAYNYQTGTLVSTNTASHTVTVADLPGHTIRAVLTLPPAPFNSNLAATGSLQFALDIDPVTNLAVIADTANGRVLFIPVPH